METRIGQGTSALDVTRTDSAPRVTPSSGASFRDLVSRGTTALMRGAQSAVMALPGAPVVAAAVRPQSTSVLTTATSTTSGTATSATGATSTTAEGSTGSSSTTSDANSTSGIEQTLAQSQDQNLYYLQLQEQMSAENRSYTAMSNVLKARHDTVKNAIGNIR